MVSFSRSWGARREWTEGLRSTKGRTEFLGDQGFLSKTGSNIEPIHD